MAEGNTSSPPHRLFVYGTLMRGGCNHFFLSDARFLGCGITQAPMAMWADSYPFVSEKLPLYPIHGELYEIDDLTLEKTDLLEECPADYQRIMTTIQLEDSTTLDAWIYVNDIHLTERSPLPHGRWPLPSGKESRKTG